MIRGIIPWWDIYGRLVIGYRRQEYATPIIPIDTFGPEGSTPLMLCEMHRWFEIHPVFHSEDKGNES
jgi:hypothetical protein